MKPDTLTTAQKKMDDIRELVESSGYILEEVGLADNPRDELESWLDLSSQLVSASRALYDALKKVRETLDD
jgi:hypothetical protein